MSRPNVLFVLTDEWRAQSVGYRGDPNADTPRLDRFAAESIDFTNAISGTPVCCPARASLLTGKHALQHGVFINDVELEPTSTTLGEAFRDAGYRTGYIGKWHLHGSPDGNYGRREKPVPASKHFGFDYWKAAECTHDYQHSIYYEGDDPEPKYWRGYDAFAQTDDAIGFITATAADDRPFFLFLSYGPPHFPLDNAPRAFQERYRDATIALRPNVPESAAQEATEALRGYYAHIAAMDTCFGRLMEALEDTGLAEDTIVVFTSDHGDMMGSQGVAPEVKVSPWDESVCVPFLLRYPARFGREGWSNMASINTPDVMPTLLRLAGIEVPAGVSGVDALTSPPDSAFIALPVPILLARTYGFAEYRGVRTDRYTYVRTRSGPWLLYDNHADPFQLNNLVDAPSAAPVRDQLDAKVQDWLRRLDDDFEPAEEYLQRAGWTHFLEVNNPIGHSSGPDGQWTSTMQEVS